MRFSNAKTGDIVEVPPPNIFGRSVVRFNGRVVERVVYSDEAGGTVTTESRVFRPDEWAFYLAEQLRTGAWKVVQ
jgi:hypothetical protein